ncbi:hypothetical protein CH366_17190 [Leptospira harrisiae]|nr:hypothetical protein CH366_17190 [Leptospira harrisiae]
MNSADTDADIQFIEVKRDNLLRLNILNINLATRLTSSNIMPTTECILNDPAPRFLMKCNAKKIRTKYSSQARRSA